VWRDLWWRRGERGLDVMGKIVFRFFGSALLCEGDAEQKTGCLFPDF